MPILLCHVVWMPFYAGEEEVHAAGFDYVRDEGYGHELLNFKVIDGTCYGYVQSRSGVINIDRLGADEDDTFVDGVDVIWTATSPQGGERLIVGWYRAARVYRNFQKGRLQGRTAHGAKIGYLIRVRTAGAILVQEKDRNFRVPHHGKGLPGQNSVFYPEDSRAPEMETWLGTAREYIRANVDGGSGGARLGAPKGWPCSPDAAHNAAVEAAAVAFLRERLGMETRDRQKDNCGWDLEFAKNGRTLCVEVKGLSAGTIGVELSPNEYAAMQRVMTGSFPEGEYRLAVVCNALSAPQLFLFAHAGALDWMCEITSQSIRIMERVAARLG